MTWQEKSIKVASKGAFTTLFATVSAIVTLGRVKAMTLSYRIREIFHESFY